MGTWNLRVFLVFSCTVSYVLYNVWTMTRKKIVIALCPVHIRVYVYIRVEAIILVEYGMVRDPVALRNSKGRFSADIIATRVFGPKKRQKPRRTKDELSSVALNGLFGPKKRQKPRRTKDELSSVALNGLERVYQTGFGNEKGARVIRIAAGGHSVIILDQRSDQQAAQSRPEDQASR
jgi:hypothetical protein